MQAKLAYNQELLNVMLCNAWLFVLYHCIALRLAESRTKVKYSSCPALNYSSSQIAPSVVLIEMPGKSISKELCGPSLPDASDSPQATVVFGAGR